MEFLINNKPFEEWTIEEINYLIANSDTYRENEYIDYKRTFDFLECTDKNAKSNRKQEFCNDICSFANAESGYLFYGIDEEKGEPNSIIGITITDKDRFELDRRNDLNNIQPVIPSVKFSFIQIDNNYKYIVVIYIEKGNYGPYVARSQDESYKFYIRSGNKKRMMSYKEIEQMFKNSSLLSKDISCFVNNRVDKYMNEYKYNDKPFILVHIIPSNFMDRFDGGRLYKKYKSNEIGFSGEFNSFCIGEPVPFVDGLYFSNVFMKEQSSKSTRFFNNGIAELCLESDEYEPLYYDEQGHNRLCSKAIYNEIIKFSMAYVHIYNQFTVSNNLFFSISIINMNGVVTQKNLRSYSIIHDNRIVCDPISLNNADDMSEVKELEDNLKLIFLLACGITPTENE